jgi:lipopolysaccharide export system protein LptA
VRRLGVIAAGLLALATAPAGAQGLNILDRKSDAPIEIEADDGIEWRQEDRTYIARGNVKVVRGEVTLYADTVIAHYRTAGEGPPPAAKPGQPAKAPPQKGQQAQQVKPGEPEKPAGGTEIWKIDAIGKMRIDNKGEQAFADRGVYNVDLGVLTMTGKVRLLSPRQNTAAYGDEAVYDTNQSVTVLTGKALRFDSPDTKITARDSLEYYDAKNLAVARGDAVAVQADKRVRADVLTAHLNQGRNQQAAAKPGDPKAKQPPAARPVPATPGAPSTTTGGGVERIDAFGNVLLSSTESIARGQKAVYTVSTGVAIVTGGVKVTRGESQMNGEQAEVNMNTGVSRILSSSSPASPGQRVRALFAPAKTAPPPGAQQQMNETKEPPPPDDPARPRLPGQAVR